MILDESGRSVTDNNGGLTDCWDLAQGDWVRDSDGYAKCSVDFKDKDNHQSQRWHGEDFYRFMEPAGVRLPESAPEEYHCGTFAPGWLNGTHPTKNGVEVKGTVCFGGNEGDYPKQCKSNREISITECLGFYVYYLPNAWGRYCGAPNRTITF